MSHSLLSKKSSPTSRRNIIIYIIATILILGIVAGFTNVFHTDNRRFAAEWGETIVMESKPPESGTPSDYDLLSNLKYAAYKIHHAKYFKGYTEGRVSADIGVGNYTQYLTNTRVVYNQNTVFTETISWSSLKSLAEQKYADNGIIIYRAADKTNGGKATFSSKAAQMSYEEYSKNYGTVPNQLSKYIINEQTILSVKDENAPKAAALNGNGSDGVSFDVPERLVPDADGNYVFTLTLDPTASSLYYRNEVRTLGGADQNPKFFSVKITVTVNSDWIPLSTRTLEVYDIEIPVLGAMRCSGDNYEVFSMIDDENGEIPEKDFFQPYVDEAKSRPGYKPPEIGNSNKPLSASDYLASAFAGYLSGEQNLNLTADVSVNGIPVMDTLSAYDLALSVNLDTLDIQAQLDNGLYVKYAGDKVYVKNKDLVGYVSTDDAKKLMDDPLLKGLLTFGELDLNKIFGGDMLDVIFKDCEMTEEDGITDIPMSFSLDLSDIIPALDDVKVDASIKINTDDKSLNSIAGTVTIGDVTIDIEAQPLDTLPKFPSVDGAKNLSAMLDFVPDALATAMQTTYGIDGTLELNGITVGLSAYVDRTDGLKAGATLNVGGLDVLVTYLDGTVYASALGVNVCGTMDELPALLNALLDLTDFGKYEKLIKAMLPSSVNQIVDMLDTVTVNGNALDIGLSFIGMPINVSLTRGDGKLQSVALGVNVDMFGIKADVAANLNLSEPNKRDITAPIIDSALTFTDLATLIKQVKPYLDADYFTAEIDGFTQIDGTQGTINGNLAIDKITDKNKNVIGIAAAGKLSAFGQDIAVTYTDGIAYVALNDIKAKLDTADNSLISSIMQLVELLTGNYEMPEIDLTELDGAIKSATMTDGTLSLAISVSGCDVTVSINLKSGKIAIAATINGVNVEFNINIATAKKSHAITAPTDASEYMDISALSALASTATRIIEAGGIHTVANVVMGDISLDAAVDCTIENGMLKEVVREDSLGLTVILLGDTAYIEVGGIKVSGQLKDINDIMDAVIPNLPDPIRPYIVKMTQIMLGIIPSQDELTTDGKMDITKTIDTIFAMLTSLSIDGEQINIGISRGALSATLSMATDLSYMSGDVALTFDGIGGPFGESYTMAFGLSMKGLIASNVTVPMVNTAEYVKASDLLAALNCVLPLVKQNAFDLGVSVTVFDQTVIGNAYIDLGEYTLDTIAVKARLMIAGAPVTVTLINKTLYLDINDGSVRLAQQLTKTAIKVLLAQIEQALPELGLSDKIDSLLNSVDTDNIDISISDLLNNISLSPTANGMALTATFGTTTVNANIVITDGVLSAVNVNCNIAGKQVEIALDVQTADGVLCGIQTTKADIMGTALDLGLALTPAESKREITPDGEYVQIAEFIPYIAPIRTLMERATSANTVTVDLSDMIIEIMGKQITVSGKVDLSLNPVNVRAVLTLFADSDTDKVDLTVVYADSVLYISIGKISLKFDIQKDMSKLNEAIAPYMPKSLQKLGDLGALSPIFAIIDNIGKITNAQDAAEMMSILFDSDNAYNKSMVQLVADMLRLYKRGTDGSIVVGITVMETPFEITLNVQPIIDNGYLDFKLSTTVSSMLALGLTAKLDFTNEEFTVSTPTNADSYTPIVDFVTTVINGVNTLTAKVPDTVTTDSDGNTTTVSQTAFEMDSFAFDYDIFQTVTEIDENGETVEVKDDAGRAQIAKDADGNKIKEKTIQISNIDGQNALRFGLTTTKIDYADGRQTSSTKLAIEAHVRLNIIGADGNAQIGFPIELDLYVQPLDTDEGGLAYLYYREANGYGEKISIDYKSVLQMVAAVLDILSVDDATVESLLGNYRLDIDKAVFESMSIAGLDSITELLNNLIKALDEAKVALSDAKAAWNRVQDAEDLDALIYEILNDTTKKGENATVKAYLDSAISHVKAAIALFGTDDEETDDETPEQEDNKLNGAIVGKVVNSVYFRSANSVLSAYVDNAVATGTEGWAVVSVTSADDKVNNIGVKNLDVNTAKLNTFDMGFAPTQNVTVTIPDDYTAEDTSDDKVRYADLANLKHLLFDVMNTANMLEFDIGGLNTSDAINVHMKLGADWLANLKLNIKYNVKVKIIKTGEDKNGKPIYQTAAMVELHNEKSQLEILGIGSKVIVPDCTTRLYFYDDVIYIQGVRSWQTDNIERVVGTVTDIYCIADVWGSKQTRYPTVNSTEYVASTTDNFDYIEAMFTIDELFWMISNDMNKFLNEFLFYLIPITTEKIAGQDIRGLITDNIGGSSSDTVNTQNTIAQIFKEYAYAGGEHTLRIGLKELVGSSALSDLTVKIKGANDGDDNVLDNYISSLSVNTSIANIITVDLNATLNNVAVAADGSDIYSKGLAPTNVTLENGKYSLNGANYVYECYNYDRNTLYTLDGLTYFTADGNGLYIENGSFAPALRDTDSSDVFTWTSMSANTRYCDSVYKFGDTGATYYYTTSLNGYGYRYDGNDTYYLGTDGDGNRYVYRIENGNQIRVEVKGITTSLLADVTRDAQGKIISVANRNGGVQWTRPWQAAYEAAAQAA
ncbi:MAG: hypothetical protein K2M47_07700 [Clostridiales bacterium]|nr:hypothetical protein [Clostridiales bacterium]